MSSQLAGAQYSMCVESDFLLAMQHPAADSAGKPEGGDGRPAADRQPNLEAGVEGLEKPGLPGQNRRYNWLPGT